jgi:hypothetical protein
MLRALFITLMLVCSTTAQAFCGFYVSGADASLYNDATLVVLMRSGRRTVLSMQNTYQGPPEAFAMVVPVPQVLQKENVKTLPAEIFKRVDQLAAPRLVEYWEHDPCAPLPWDRQRRLKAMQGPTATSSAAPKDFGVTIEAQFEVGEYDIVILSAKDSGGLDSWLRHEKYNIPKGAESVLRPYVESGTKFFVAKVDPERVTFTEGRAVLSPLRVHYDSETFSLPVRLGLLNSSGEQDLLVHILAPNQRYEMANYNNAFIPTNLRVKNEVRDGFGSFYEALFKEVSKPPRTVVTEYSWDASSCDPCPTPALSAQEIATLGGDVLGEQNSRSMVLTRLHYRYGADGLDEDLVFKTAEGAYGGRGTPNTQGEMTEQGATVRPGSRNNFQGRYIILHRWDGEVACDSPVRGQWGGPNNSKSTPKAQAAASRMSTGGVAAKAAPSLGALLIDSIPGIAIASEAPPTEDKQATEAPEAEKPEGGAAELGCASVGAAAWCWLLVLPWMRRRRRGGQPSQAAAA